MNSEFTEQVSNILLEVLVENANNQPPHPHSHKFADWERETKVQMDFIADKLVNILDKRYRLKD